MGRSEGFERSLLWAAQVYLIAALIVQAFIDFDFKILDDGINYSGLAAGLILCTAFPFLHLGAPLEAGWPFWEEPAPLWSRTGPFVAAGAASLWGAAVGAGMTWLVGRIFKPLFRREAMGLGDVKLMAFLGAWLGWQGALLTFFLGCLYGSAYGVGQWPFTRRMGEVWFGPFLALGALSLIVASKGVHITLAVFIGWNQRLADKLMVLGPWAMLAAAAVPLVVLAWLFHRIWKRSREGDQDAPAK
jgi:leader peptidase (prepilin peptidase)/N-methyltransferase